MTTLTKVPEPAAKPVQAPAPPSDRVLRAINPFVSRLLRSPLHFVLSDSLLLLTYTGRKSGKRYTIPVAYDREDDMITVFTSHAWWKNLRGGAPVQVETKRIRYHARAEANVDDAPATVTALLALMRRKPSMAKVFKIPLDTDGQPQVEAVRQIAQHEVVVRIRLGPVIAR